MTAANEEQERRGSTSGVQKGKRKSLENHDMPEKKMKISIGKGIDLQE